MEIKAGGALSLLAAVHVRRSHGGVLTCAGMREVTAAHKTPEPSAPGTTVRQGPSSDAKSQDKGMLG